MLNRAKTLINQGASLNDAIKVVFAGSIPDEIKAINRKAIELQQNAVGRKARLQVKRTYKRAILFYLHTLDRAGFVAV